MLFMNRTSMRMIVFGLVAAFSLFSCGKTSTEKMQNENPPSAKKFGMDALLELREMAKSIPIGSSCQLSSMTEDLSSWSFKQPGADIQMLSFQDDQISATEAERVTRDSVPYWRISGEMKSSGGDVINLQWQVREDQNVTTSFSLMRESGSFMTELEQCQL